MRKLILKTYSFLISMLPLIILLGIKYICCIINNWQRVLSIFIVYILFIVIGFFYWKNTRRGTKIPFKVVEVKSNNEQQILYFMTYIIPLISPEGNIESLVQLAFIMAFMFALYYKSNLFYANPVLSLFGRNIFTANIENSTIRNEAIILTKKNINELKYKEQKGLYLIDEEVIFII